RQIPECLLALIAFKRFKAEFDFTGGIDMAESCRVRAPYAALSVGGQVPPEFETDTEPGHEFEVAVFRIQAQQVRPDHQPDAVQAFIVIEPGDQRKIGPETINVVPIAVHDTHMTRYRGPQLRALAVQGH